MAMKSHKTVDAYLRSFPPAVQKELRAIRKTIRAAAPKATERIAYGIPAFYMGQPVVYFAGFAKHLSFFPTSSGVRKFSKELARFETSKGTVRFPLGSRIPHALIAKIVRYRVKQVSER